jgi:hypothetical protein
MRHAKQAEQRRTNKKEYLIQRGSQYALTTAV